MAVVHDGGGIWRNREDGTPVIKEHPKVCTKGSAGAGTPEAWRNGIPHRFEGGNGAIMIGADSAAEEKSVARGLIIDPGGEIIKVHPGEIEQARGGKIQDPGGGEEEIST